MLVPKLIPFESGQLASPDEVNKNFEILRQAVNTNEEKISSSISGYKKDSVYKLNEIIINVEDGLPVIYQSLVSGNIEPLTNRNYWERFDLTNMPTFTFNSGPVDKNGEPALTTIQGNIITMHSPAVCTTASGETHIITQDATLDVSNLADGTYNIFYNPDTKLLFAYNNKIYIQKAMPKDWATNDVWVDTSVLPNIAKMKKSDVEVVKIDIVPNAVLTRISGEGTP